MRIVVRELLVIIMLCLFSSGVFAGISGLHRYGTSAESTGGAGTGVSRDGAAFYYLNPASLSSIEQYTLSGNYGSFDSDMSYADLSLFIPGSWGVFALSWTRLALYNEVENVEPVNYFSAGMGKYITGNFSFGINIEGAVSPTENYLGLGTGFRYSIPFSFGRRGFTIFDPSFGLSGALGYKSSDEVDYSSASGGYSFIFYRQPEFSIRFINDVSWLRGEEIAPVKFGLEFSYGSVFAMRSGIVIPQDESYIKYTGGASVGYKTDRGGVTLDYAFTVSEKREMDHFAGLTLSYGDLDRAGPETAIKVDRPYISPNEDGVQDYMTFSTHVRDVSPIKGWKLEIIDSSGSTVKRYHVSERTVNDSLTLSTFAKRLFSSRESIVVPEQLIWDGRNDIGEKVSDGKYTYNFFAWDSKDNIAPVKSGVLFVDTKGPAVKISDKGFIFSPNADGNRDTLVIPQKIETSPEDQWIGIIRDAQGTAVRKYSWSGMNIPDSLKWDGRSNSGKEAPDGLYSYEIESSDKAGNKTSAMVKEIVLVRSMETVDVTVSREFISYERLENARINFFSDIPGSSGIERWELAVVEGENSSVKSIVGTGSVPAVISWDGLDSNGDKLDDGEYSFQLRVWYVSGNNPSSFRKKITVDNSPPELSVSHDPSLFSPDDDGESDYLNIELDGKDEYGIDRWELNVISENGFLFKKFSGEGNPPEKLKWDGVGDKRELVESASDYILEFNATDFAGNKSETVRDRISVDVLVVVTERGLKMRISNIQFPFGSSRIKKRGRRILDRVYSILERYGDYNVVIEGHTDDIGKESYNVKLSEARALSVKKYLESKGTAPERLQYRGLGESMPFYPNSNVENRRRNRRVEFLLIKHKGEGEERGESEKTETKIKGESF